MTEMERLIAALEAASKPKPGVKKGFKTSEFWALVGLYALVGVDAYVNKQLNPALFVTASAAATAYIAQRGFAKRNDSQEK